MFLEAPSTRTMLDGFMVKEGRTFSEFEGLVGFNKIYVDYHLLQAATLLYYENLGSKAPCQIGEMTINEHNIYIKILDNNNALLHIDISLSVKVDITYNYSTDNFPIINYNFTNGNYNLRCSSKLIGVGSPLPLVANMEIANDICDYIPYLLWQAYQKKMSDKK